MKRLIDYRLSELQRLHVPVLYQKNADAETVKAYAPDLIVLAVGSTPVLPRIDGLDSEYVYTADDALRLMQENDWRDGMRCAVLGGGLTGLEVADALCANHCATEVFELSDQAGRGLAKERRVFLFQRLKQGGCKLHLNSRVNHIADRRIVCESNGEIKEFGPFDAIVVALGRKSETQLYDDLRSSCPSAEIVVLGDACKPATVLEATASAALFVSGWDKEKKPVE